MVHITKSIVASVGIVWWTSVVATVFDSYKTPNTIYSIQIWLEFVIFSNFFFIRLLVCLCVCVFSLSPFAYIAVYCCMFSYHRLSETLQRVWIVVVFVVVVIVLSLQNWWNVYYHIIYLYFCWFSFIVTTTIKPCIFGISFVFIRNKFLELL